MRVVFWSYERGTWQYDIAVVAIVLFVLFSPYLVHFNDQPSVGPPSSQAVIELRAVAPGQISTYRVDARLLASPIRTPELEHDLHDAMRKNTEGLRHGNFRILRIEPIRGEGDTVISYDVTIGP